jgi:hypothetical protein
MSGSPLADVSAEGLRVVSEAGDRGLTVRLVGGTAVAARCPSARRPPLARPYKDVDVVGRRSERVPLRDLLVELGYEPNEEFNLLQGDERLLFWDKANDRQLDVLLDRFELCHALDLGDRLELDEVTLTPADLLLTKLQVWETNERDLRDAVALLADCEIDLDRVAEVLGSDWGWWRTALEVLGRVEAYAAILEPEERTHVEARIAALRDRVEQEPKSLRWKARAKVGERVRWYEEPDENY